MATQQDEQDVLQCEQRRFAAMMQGDVATVDALLADDLTYAHSGGSHMMDSHKGKNDTGIRGHGFVADSGVFTTIDAPGAGLFTGVFGIDESGKTVGGYIDDRGRLHGFLRDKEAFTVIDFPGAKATVASKINTQGQIVGAYSENSNTPALDLPHGFLFDKGVFTTIEASDATAPSTIVSDINDMDSSSVHTTSSSTATCEMSTGSSPSLMSRKW